MKRIINILLISFLVQTITFAQGVGVDSVQVVNALADSVADNTIKDTILLKYSRGIVPFETIEREGTKYYAVTSDGHKEEITSFINGRKRVMVKDGDGHELVIDKDGNVMGVEEYKKCGGSAKLLSEHNAYRDSTMATSGNVKFSKVKDENYGFDEWRGADYDKDVYDNFNGYRPTYIGAQKQSSIKVKASQTKGVRFITERGVPIIANTADNTLNLAIGTAGKQTVYAYSDSTLVGKLCIQAYDTKEVKVHVVRVNNGKQLELNKIADEVNRIYSSAVVHYTFDELAPITIEYANGKHFVHGGKGTFQNYNADQKTAIKALPKTADQNDYYLFFTECYNRLDTAGNMSREAVNGYMPVGRHYGFIYNEYNNARTIAHELGHGTNSLHHTFSAESETFRTTEKTDNLMDYNGGDYLNHRQWQWSHEKHRNVLGFLDDEEESEMREQSSIKWLGDWLEGYFYDDLEKAIENQLTIYDDVASNFDSYYEKSAKENVGLESWSIRKSAHTSNICGKIFEKISKKENPQFTLHEKGIFTQKYTLEEKEYRVAILSYAEKCALESKNIKLESYSKLADNKYIKAGYTKRSGGYGIIALFDGDKPTMIIQIIDSEPQLAVEKWLNYLSLILPSNEQKKADGDNIKGFEIHPIEKLIEIWNALFQSEDFKKLQQIEELTPKEIKEYRDYIKTLPEENQADWYLELQKKVPYHNQRNNTSRITRKDGTDVNIGDVMCNITCTAMALEMLGLENPCAPDIEQFEDCIETEITVKHYGTFNFEQLNDSTEYDNSREWHDSRNSAVLNMYGDKVEVGDTTCYMKKDAGVAKEYIISKLKRGDGVIVSFAGHFIRIVSCDDEGFVYDDPYGTFTITKSNPRKWNNANKLNVESGVGDNNVRKWSDFDILTNKTKFYIEYYHEK